MIGWTPLQSFRVKFRRIGITVRGGNRFGVTLLTFMLLGPWRPRRNKFRRKLRRFIISVGRCSPSLQRFRWWWTRKLRLKFGKDRVIMFVFVIRIRSFSVLPLIMGVKPLSALIFLLFRWGQVVLLLGVLLVWFIIRFMLPRTVMRNGRRCGQRFRNSFWLRSLTSPGSGWNNRLILITYVIPIRCRRTRGSFLVFVVSLTVFVASGRSIVVFTTRTRKWRPSRLKLRFLPFINILVPWRPGIIKTKLRLTVAGKRGRRVGHGNPWVVKPKLMKLLKIVPVVKPKRNLVLRPLQVTVPALLFMFIFILKLFLTPIIVFILAVFFNLLNVMRRVGRCRT